MVNISLQFTAGGFHATPWGRHVNEGAVEWPPSQWRFLRALISVWHLKLRDKISRETLSEIIERLSEPPEFYLPAASLSGTRHYMPGQKFKEGVNRDVSLVIDSAVSLDKEAKLFLYWKNTDLSTEGRDALTELLGGLAYLGRAESWVSAQLEENPPELINCSQSPFPNSEQTLTACTFSAANYSDWQKQSIGEIESMKLSEKKQKLFQKNRDSEKAKLSKKDKEKAEKEIPETLLDALEVSTADLRKSGWNCAPGLRFVVYHRSRSCFDMKPVSISGIHKKVSAVRFAVSSAVLPRITDAVSVGERVRTAIMSIAGGQNDGNVPWVFSGKGNAGSPLQKNHSHSYYLSESCNGNGKISHITVFSRSGFDRASVKALLSLRRVWGREGYDLQLIPMELGAPSDLGGADVRKGKSPLMALSAHWESKTPFYPVRHPKMKASQRKNPESRYLYMKEYYRDEARRELRNSGFPEPVQVEVLDTRGIIIDGHFTSCLKFNSKRKGSGRRASVPPVILRITFDEPVRGPVAIGYSAHYGLGLFSPVVTECL